MTASRQRRKQVRLTSFDNEPMARLAEQRLRQEGIPCFVRSLGVGPGAWGTAYNLPHGLYIYQADEMRSREVLGLVPEEITERERQKAGPDHFLAFRLTLKQISLLLICFSVMVVWLLLVIFWVIVGRFVL